MAERRTLETILTENKLLSEEQLKQIVRYAHAVGIELYEAVLQKKVAHPDVIMMAYAESVGLPFIHLADFAVDEEVAVQIDPVTARQYSLIPVSIDQGYVLLATTKPVIPDVADELRMTFSLPVRCMICTPAELSAAIAKYYPRGAVRVTKTEQGKVPPPQSVTKKSKPDKQEKVEPMSDEEIKNRLWLTVAAFNFTVALVFFSSYYLPLARWIGDQFFVVPLLVFFAGCGAALITWKALSR